MVKDKKLGKFEKEIIEEIKSHFYKIRKEELEKNKSILQILDLKVTIEKVAYFYVSLKIEDLVEILFEDEEEPSQSKLSFTVKINRFFFNTLNVPAESKYYIEENEYSYHPEMEVHQ